MKTTPKDRAVAILAAGIQRMLTVGFTPKEIETATKTELGKMIEQDTPSPFCFGNPTKADCIRHGRCTRNPSCNE